MSEALAAGAAPYKPPHQRQEELAHAKGKTRVNIQSVCDGAVLLWFALDHDVHLSVEPGTLRPLPAYQHVVLQHQ